MPLIEAKDLTFFYSGEKILNHISLEIFSGEFVGIIGPNGGGKTTFLKLLMGQLKPSSGTILINQQPPKASRTKIGYVPQILKVDRQFPISVFELVLGGRISKNSWWQPFSKEDKDKVINEIEKVGLIDFKDQPFGTLSGGQAQRALIARALATQPEILLLDEPTASVDSSAEAQIYDLLKHLKRQCTIIMVTHDLKAVMNDIDRVLCIQREVIALNKDQVCEHYAIGLYHSPYVNVRKS
jgi:zinc transport system ATP-binding protein